MRLISWPTARLYISILDERSCSHFKSGVVKFFTSKPVLYRKIGKEDYLSADYIEKEPKKRKHYSKDGKFKGSEFSSKREKNAEHSDPELVEWELRNKNLVKNALPGETKKSSQSDKRFRLRCSTSDHDLQTKIDSIMKYLEKGRKVSCEIIAVHEKDECGKMLAKLNNSKLKSYFINSFGKDMKMIASYGGKTTDNETAEVQEKKGDKSS